MVQYTEDITRQVNESLGVIRNHTDRKQEIAIILGTGLNDLAKNIEIENAIPYEEIPHFSKSFVEFHQSRLLFGKISGKNIVAMQGRYHYYEGRSMQEITHPVRVMKALGAKLLIISNAAGSMNPDIKNSEIALIEDHINLLGQNPLIGLSSDDLGPRFTDMSEPYKQKLINEFIKIAEDNNIKIHKVVYVAMTGPSLETRAEYKFLRMIGADVVGMSTVPECIMANHLGMDVVGISIVTDECNPDDLKPISIKEVLENAEKAEPKLTLLIKKFIEKY
jgi:purine-nucleoside phosphorylase